MNPENVFQLETAETLRSRFSLFMRFGFTWVAGLFLTILPLDPATSVTGLLMLFLFTTFFGSLIATTRRRSEGRFSRLRLLPLPLPRIAGDYFLAGSLVSLVRLTPLLILFVLARGQGVSPGLLLHLTGLLALSVFVLQGAGMLVGLATKSNQDAHLLGVLATGLLALLSGLLPLNGGIPSLIRQWTPWNPIAALGGSLERVLQGTAADLNSRPLAWGLVLGAVSLVFLWRAMEGKAPLKKGHVYDLKTKRRENL